MKRQGYIKLVDQAWVSRAGWSGIMHAVPGVAPSIDPTTCTLNRLLDEWVELRTPVWKTSTQRTHQFLAMRVRHSLGSIRISELTPQTIDRFYISARAGYDHFNPVSEGTVRRHHHLIAACLEAAVGWGWLDSNPARKTISQPTERRAIAAIDRRGLFRIVAAIPPDTNGGVIVRLAAVTGARRGELCALRLRDLDLDRKALRIERAISLAVDPAVRESTAKTLKLRTVSLDAGTVDAVLAHLGRQAALAKAHGVERVADPFLVSATLDGDTPYGPGSVSSVWLRSRRRIDPDGELRHVRFADLRHFAATEMIHRNQNIIDVAQRLGHSWPVSTLRSYAHEMPMRDQGMAEELASVMYPLIPEPAASPPEREL